MRTFGAIYFFLNQFLFSAPAFAQKEKLHCNEIHNGIFYFYPQNTKDQLLEVREDGYLTEKVLATGDTALWKVKWDSECVYRLTYVSGSLPLNKQVSKIVKKHDFVYKINSITDQYYTFTGYLDNTANLPIQNDTMWMNEKISIPDNALFENVPSESYEQAAKISDTSQYALLHIFRPGKITNSLGNFIVYFGNNIMNVAQNNRGYVFKVFKEGTFEMQSRLLKDVAGTTLNIEFGKKYYVKSIINWTISKRLYNFKLDMKELGIDEGMKEFDKVKYR